MKIANGVEMLELDMNFMGHQSTIHPTLLFDDDSAILVDVGLPGQLEEIKAAMNKAGVPFERLRGVILTHQDFDHIGSLPDVIASAAQPIEVYAHAEDKPYIEGDKEPIKMNRARIENMLANLPEEEKAKIQSMFSKLPTGKVTKEVSDGDVLPFFGGITVIFTPGHTPGHISLYLNESKTLITGDATVSQDGKIMGPNQNATPDMPLAMASQKKFTNFDIVKVICYHGGLCDDNVNEQFRALAK
ncbi:MBL fold metallo-hydrolase [Alicyclobacillus dauci]|uniref:MBL fold metallo-hydrolase n=1 Tax=Alicyclobacillus dauci TaxID=1475485 RepID=A0ABY6Z5J0_9BACL|nr:MBL fold metallo-hydrolase [Alicyclobacillus dauci]WAH37918.1 MBL fold metallo-hydrolase [Alicyclobacillus dauci]